MNILLFGISNVGKTTAGRIIAGKLGYDFYDLDEEVSKHSNMTIEEFVGTVWPYERDKTRGEVIGKLLAIDSNKVIAVTPMYYTIWFSKYLKRDGVLAIELQDEPENIFNRLIFTDENGQVYADSGEYREKHKKHYLREVKKDITYYKKPFSRIENKFWIGNDSPDVIADRLINQYNLADVINERFPSPINHRPLSAETVDALKDARLHQK